MSTPEAVLLANALATWYMLGVIAFVHLVHYPLFDRYERDLPFRVTMERHQNRTLLVVFPAMATEFLTSLALLAASPPAVPRWMVILGAALTGVWAVSTVLVQVPLHERLAATGFDAARHRRLVRSNAVRVAAWVLRAALTAVMVAVAWQR
ncbi:MAG: hypothetical protein C0501_12335 [Isosphaera sp.]|nr:hypothetical protein [Isosphaera sp.]